MAEGLPDLKSRVLIDTSQLDKLGGTVKGALGSAGAALAGLGITAAVGKFFKGATDAAQEAEKVMAQTGAVLKSTGGEAGVSAGHVVELSDKLSKLAGVDHEVIAQGENVLLTFTQVRDSVGKGNDVFDQATTAALDMSKALGKDLQSSIIVVGKALQDPIGGLTALKRVGVQFTDQQKDEIKALVQSGDQLKAQKIILKELQTEFGGTAAAVATPAEKLSAAWKEFQERIGAVILPALHELISVLGFLLDVMGHIPGPILVAVGALAGLAGVLLTVGKAIEVVRSIQGTLALVRDAVAGVGAAVSRLNWSQLAAGGIAAGVAAGGIFILTQRLSENRSEADKWAKGLETSFGGLNDNSLPKLRDELKKLDDQISGKSLSIGPIDIFGSDEDRKTSDRAKALKDDIKNFEGQKQVAVKETGQVWVDQAQLQGASADQIATKAADLKAKHEEAATAIKQAFSGMGAAAQAYGDVVASDVQSTDQQLQDAAKAVQAAKEAYGGLGPAADQAFQRLVTSGKLGADQIAAIAKQAQDLRDGMANSFNSATSVVQAFGNQTVVTKAQVLQFFKEQVAAARDWATNLQSLAGTAIDKGLLAEVAQAGPKMAPLVAALLDAVKSGNVNAINQAQADLRTILQGAQDVALGATSGFFTAGQQAGAGFAGGINASDPLIRAAAIQAAAVAIKAIVGHLQIFSPSRVTMRLGALTGEGFGVGLSASIPDLVARSQAMSQAVLSQLGTSALVSGGDFATVNRGIVQGGGTAAAAPASGVLHATLVADGRPFARASAPYGPAADRAFRRSRQ